MEVLKPNTFVAPLYFDGNNIHYTVMCRVPEKFAYRFNVSSIVFEGSYTGSSEDWKEFETKEGMGKLQRLGTEFATPEFPLYQY